MTSQPRYITIAETIRADIDAQVFATGTYLPSEKSLAQRFGVAPGTMRQALKVLVDEGTLSARRGAKKIVMRTPVHTAKFREFRSFAQWAYGQGKTPGGKVIDQQWRGADSVDAAKLGIDEGTPVLSVTRQRSIDGVPVMLERTNYCEDLGKIVEDLPLDIPSVTNILLNDHGIQFVAADHIFSVGVADEFEAEILGSDPGAPLLIHHRVSRDRFGTALEHSEDRYRQGSVALAVTNTEAQNSLSWLAEQ